MWVIWTSVTAWKKPGLWGTSGSISARRRPLAPWASLGVPVGTRSRGWPGSVPQPQTLSALLQEAGSRGAPRQRARGPALWHPQRAESSARGEGSKAKLSRWPWRRERGLNQSLGLGFMARRVGSVPPGCPALLAPSPPGEGERGRAAAPRPALAPGEELKAVSFRG